MLFTDDRTKKKFQKVAIIVNSEELESQLNGVLRDHNLTNKGIKVIADSNIETYGDHDLYFVDEADQVIRSFAIAFDSETKELQGLHSLRGKNVIYTSATFSNTERDFLEQIMFLGEEEFVEYVPVLEFITGKPAGALL